MNYLERKKVSQRKEKLDDEYEYYFGPESEEVEYDEEYEYEK